MIRKTFLPQTSNFTMNLVIASSIFWHLSSNCTIKFLLEITFLTSRIVSVLSLMPISSNSYLFLELRNLFILLASSRFLPSSFLTFWMAWLASLIKSFCSNLNWMEGQISLTELMILAQSCCFPWEVFLSMSILSLNFVLCQIICLISVFHSYAWFELASFIL